MAKFKVTLSIIVESDGKLNAASRAWSDIERGIYYEKKTFEELGVTVESVKPEIGTELSKQIQRERGGIFVHDDGSCKNGKFNTPLEADGRCPVCNIYPDTQSKAIIYENKSK